MKIHIMRGSILKTITTFCITSSFVLFLQNHTLAHADRAWWAWPGQKYYIGIGNQWSYCSVGFPAWDNYGNTYFITAGHCFRDDNGRHYEYSDGSAMNIYSPDDDRIPVGWEYLSPESSSNYMDISLVKMYPGKRINAYGWPDINTWPHAGQLGGKACIVGARSDHVRCGTINAVNIYNHMTGYEWGTMLVDNANYCSWPGDSGGAVFDDEGALGIENSGTLQGTCYTGNQQFTPILDALNWLRKSVPTLHIY